MTDQLFTVMIHVPEVGTPAAARFDETLESVFSQSLPSSQVIGLVTKNPVQFRKAFRTVLR